MPASSRENKLLKFPPKQAQGADGSRSTDVSRGKSVRVDGAAASQAGTIDLSRTFLGSSEPVGAAASLSPQSDAVDSHGQRTRQGTSAQRQVAVCGALYF